MRIEVRIDNQDCVLLQDAYGSVSLDIDDCYEVVIPIRDELDITDWDKQRFRINGCESRKVQRKSLDQDGLHLLVWVIPRA